MTTSPLADRTTTAAARATDLSKIYGQGETQVVALDRVSVDFRQAEFTAIMGPSGSGKSTLMHCVAGLDTFSSGSVRIGDTELGSLKDKQLTKLRRDKIGFIFQAFNLLPTLTALENITLPMDIAGRKPDKEWLDKVIRMVGLADRLSHRPSQLSGGQQQRVAVARALASPAGHHLRRRADRQPRLALRRRGAGLPAQLRAGAGADGGDGDPRPGGRGLRGPGDLPRGRADRRRGVRADGRVGAGPHEAVRRQGPHQLIPYRDLPLADEQRPEKTTPMFRTALRNVLAHKARLLMTVLAVMLGVAFVSGTLVFTNTLSDALQKSSAKGFDQVDVAVTAEPQPDVGDRIVKTPELTQALLERSAKTPGAASAVGVVTGFTAMADKDGKLIGGGFQSQGGNYWGAKDTRYPLVSGRAPSGVNEVVIDAKTAERAGYEVGDTVRLSVDGPVLAPRITGVFTTDDGNVAAGGSLALFDTASAQKLFGKPGAYDEIDVKAAPGTSQSALKSALDAALPKGQVETTTGKQLADDQAEMISASMSGLKQGLLVFAGIALFVGIFIIANTFTMLVAQRTKELALLRAVGASRRQVTRSVLVEALVVGAVAARDRPGRRRRHRGRAALPAGHARGDRPRRAAGRLPGHGRHGPRSSASSSPCSPPGCPAAAPRRSRRSPR